MQAWDVRAVDIAKLALEAFVCDVVLLRRGHLARVLIVVLVDVIKQCCKLLTKLETQTASMAQVVHALQFLAGVGLIKIELVMGIVNSGH